jgi:hypothetical protein
MPYKVKGKCVYKDTGKKVGCTKGPVNKYLAALYANVKEEVEKDHSTFDRADMEEACMYVKKAIGRLRSCEKPEAKEYAVKLEVLCSQLEELIG